MNSTEDTTNFICNKRFVNMLNHLHKLKEFLFEEKIRLKPDKIESIDLGQLNNLRGGSRSRICRQPTDDEWRLLDKKLSILIAQFNDDLWQKVRIKELSIYFQVLSIVFLAGSIAGIVWYLLIPLGSLHIGLTWGGISVLGSLFLWTLSQGGLGACALLATRVSFNDPKHPLFVEFTEHQASITDKHMVQIRILLGCLFALIFALPFSSHGLEAIRDWLTGTPNAPINIDTRNLDSTTRLVTYGDPTSKASILWIAVPFILGFSMQLVFTLISRLITSIQTFFGIVTQPRRG